MFGSMPPHGMFGSMRPRDLPIAGALIAPQAIITKCDTNRASSGQASFL
jgi:hypothetical protein